MRYFHYLMVAAATVALVFLPQTASASLQLDFAGFADNYDGNLNNSSVNNERGWGFGETLTGTGLGWQGPDTKVYAWNSVYASDPGNAVLSGALTMTANTTSGNFRSGLATATAGSGGPYAYTDKWSGGPGGLGVTQLLTSGLQANPSSDDNVSGIVNDFNREIVGFSVNQAITLTGLTFRNAGHGDLSGSIMIDYTTDGGTNWTRDTVTNLSNFTQSLAANSLVAFGFVPGQGGTNGSNGQFYLSSVQYIPEASSGLIWMCLAITAGRFRGRRRLDA